MAKCWLGCALWLAMWPVAAFADDSIAELTNRGLQFVHTPDIAMVAEDLNISEKEVRVRFVFRNLTQHDVTLRVAFPLPKVPPWCEGIDVPHWEDPKNYVDFATQVDGVRVTTQPEIRAMVGKRNIAKDLLRLHVPLMPHCDAIEEAKPKLDAAALRALVAIGAVDEYSSPNWTLQVTHHWLQRFPAGRDLILEHRYKPSVGGSGTGYRGRDDKDWPARKRAFCVAKAFKGGHVPDLRAALDTRIDYILTTGANWAGPIGRFHLVVDTPGPKHILATCFPGLQRTGPTRYEVTLTDYTPKGELRVMFLER